MSTTAQPEHPGVRAWNPLTVRPDEEADDRFPCRENDPELWFADAPEVVETAKALCAGCPIQRSCLEGALLRREPWGVWGGHLLHHGVAIPRKRPRGRPRKDAA